LSEQFSTLFDVKHAYAFDSGRVALHAALRALQVKKGDHVVVQSFTCVVVPDAVIATGAKPIYVDIDETYNIDVTALRNMLAADSNVKTVIVQHTFGQPARIHEIIRLCTEFGVTVVEDCAHSLGAKVGGQLVGTFGDAAIFSFGRDKVLSSVSGGIAIANRSDVSKRLADYYATLPYPSRHWIAQRLIYPAIFEKAKWWYHVGPIGKLIIEITKRLHITPLVIAPKEKRGHFPTPHKMPAVLAMWATKHLRLLKWYNKHRQKLAAIYTRELAELIADGTLVPQPTHAGTESIWLRWSMQTERAEELRRVCKKYGILLGNWYDTPVAPRDTDLDSVHYAMGCAPRAEQLGRRIVNLPTSITTSEKDAEYTAKMIKQFFAQ
jgi:dTDP-4-amino-4,6-dideoxygalactose transaminase